MPNTEPKTDSLSRSAFPVDAVATTLCDAMDRSQAMFSAGSRLWAAEMARFVDELAIQGQATFEQLCACRTPMDFLSLQRAWLSDPSRLYLGYVEFGLRFAEAFDTAARAAGWNGSRAAAPARTPARP